MLSIKDKQKFKRKQFWSNLVLRISSAGIRVARNGNKFVSRSNRFLDLGIWDRAFNPCFVQNSLRLCLPKNVNVDPCFANSIFFEDNQVDRLSTFKQCHLQQNKGLFYDSWNMFVGLKNDWVISSCFIYDAKWTYPLWKI